MKTLIIILCLLCTGCTPYYQIGLSAYATDFAEPEIGFEDPILGHVEIGAEVYENLYVYGRHTSALLQCEDGGGLNEFGVYYYFGGE